MVSDHEDAVSNPSRAIELDIDIGADARDWSSIQAQEKLKPIETDLRRMEETVSEIVSEMEYLRAREQKLRDTNESTNERVKWFAFGTMGMLVGLGAWQVVYLRAYFRLVLCFSSRLEDTVGSVAANIAFFLVQIKASYLNGAPSIPTMSCLSWWSAIGTQGSFRVLTSLLCFCMSAKRIIR